MTHDEAMTKAAKLLRLAQSDNPNEAALAAAHAQAIMTRYKIETLSADYGQQNGQAATPRPNEPIQSFNDPLDADKTSTWKTRLAVAIAKQNQCKIFLHHGKYLSIIGRASDAINVRMLYAWLTKEINRLSGLHCRGEGRTYYNNFRIGAVETVAERLARDGQHELENMKQEAIARDLFAYGENRGALIVVENAIACREKQLGEVEAWTRANMRLGRGRSSNYRYDSGAREAGRRAGATIGLRPAGGSNGGGGGLRLR